MYTEHTDTASKTVLRQQRVEWELSYVTLNAVFQAKETNHLKMLLDRDIFDNPDYQKLPKFRQLALQAYFRGVCDAVARVAGVTVPQVKIKSVPPKKTRKTRVKPDIRPVTPIPTPLPPWADIPRPELLHRSDTILPPGMSQSVASELGLV